VRGSGQVALWHWLIVLDEAKRGLGRVDRAEVVRVADASGEHAGVRRDHHTLQLQRVIAARVRPGEVTGPGRRGGRGRRHVQTGTGAVPHVADVRAPGGVEVGRRRSARGTAKRVATTILRNGEGEVRARRTDEIGDELVRGGR